MEANNAWWRIRAFMLSVSIFRLVISVSTFGRMELTDGIMSLLSDVMRSGAALVPISPPTGIIFLDLPSVRLMEPPPSRLLPMVATEPSGICRSLLSARSTSIFPGFS